MAKRLGGSVEELRPGAAQQRRPRPQNSSEVKAVHVVEGVAHPGRSRNVFHAGQAGPEKMSRQLVRWTRSINSNSPSQVGQRRTQESVSHSSQLIAYIFGIVLGTPVSGSTQTYVTSASCSIGGCPCSCVTYLGVEIWTDHTAASSVPSANVRAGRKSERSTAQCCLYLHWT